MKYLSHFRILPGTAIAFIYAALATKTNRIARILLTNKKKLSTRRPRFMSSAAQIIIVSSLIVTVKTTILVLCIVHFVLCIVHFVLCIVNFVLCIVNFVLCIDMTHNLILLPRSNPFQNYVLCILYCVFRIHF